MGVMTLLDSQRITEESQFPGLEDGALRSSWWLSEDRVNAKCCLKSLLRVLVSC